MFLANLDTDFTRILLVDFSSKFTKKGGYVDPTSPYGTGYTEVRDELKRLGQNYITKHQSITITSMNFVVDKESAIDNLNVVLGSKIKVVYEPLNYEAKHTVTEVVYDITTNKYSQVTIGNRKFTLYDFIKNTRGGIR